MQFINETGFPAQLFSGFIGEDVIESSVVVRATYRVGDDGDLVAHGDQWPIFTEPVQTKLGSFPTDQQSPRVGCDVVLTGTLRRAEPVRVATVTIRLGDHLRELLVSGDRLWTRQNEELVASEPEPFTEMPLSWSRAYGGTVEFEGQRGSHPLNAVGRGFFFYAADAEGKPLPNLESPERPIKAWSDRPMPACWESVQNPLAWYTVEAILENRTVGELPLQEQGEIVEGATERLAERAKYSACKPDMVLTGIDRNTTLVVVGMTEKEWKIDLRQTLDPRLEAHFGEEQVKAAFELGGLWLFVDERLLVVTFRGAFRGPYRPHEMRIARAKAAQTQTERRG